MGMFLILAFLFFIGSVIGWAIEVVFRRFISKSNPERRWINPGFLIGPYLPLYGFGLCTLYLLSSLESLPFFGASFFNKVMLVVLMGLCMTLIEYIAGIIFVKGMKVKLWDYSKEKGNIQGIICPKFSLIWAGLGAVYYIFINPYILRALRWLSENLAFSFVVGFFFGVFVIDVVYSANIMVKIRKFADQYQIVVKYEVLKSHIRESKEKTMEHAKFVFAMRSKEPLTNHLKRYLDRLTEIKGK